MDGGDGWTLPSLHAHLASAVDTLRRSLEDSQHFLESTIETRFAAAIRLYEEHKSSNEAAFTSITKIAETARQSTEAALGTALKGTESALSTALAATRAASEKLDQQTTLRFEQANEWRRALDVNVATLMPRHESEARHAILAERLAALEKGGVYVTIDAYQAAHVALRDKTEATIDGLRVAVQSLVTDVADAPSRDKLDSIVDRMTQELGNVRHELSNAVSARMGVTTDLEAKVKALSDVFTLFKDSVDDRFHTTNEWRRTFGDQQDMFLAKSTWETSHEALRTQTESNRLDMAGLRNDMTARLGTINTSIGKLQSRFAGAAAAAALVVTLVAGLVGFVGLR